MERTLFVGDTLDFPTAIPDFPATAGYTLTYRLVPRVSGTPITIISGTDSDGERYRTQVEAVTTATWTAGEYSWWATISKAGDEITVDKGVVTLLPDPRTVAAYDGRSPARAALDAVNAALSTHGSQAHVLEYTIGNRSMRFKDQADLLTMRAALAAEVWREDAAAKMAAGLPNPRQIRVRTARA
jgi:hypothetical protein